MSHLNAWRLVGAVMIILALVNFAAQFAVIPTRGDEPVTPYDDMSSDTAATPLQETLIGNIGGLTSPTGIAVVVISMVFLAVAFGLIAGKPWGVAAQLALGSDITFKVINIISQLSIGNTLADMLPAIFIIAIEVFLIYLLFHYRVTDAVTFDNKRGTPA
jgi:hypothetical protein